MQFLAINMFPVVMLILPLFVLFRQFGLLDTYLALIAGHATFTLPFAIWLMTSYMDGIPAELDQAAADRRRDARGSAAAAWCCRWRCRAWSRSASTCSSRPGTNTCSR